jgi:spoIIIJ-associated protein
MTREYSASAPTVEEALDIALAELGVSIDEVEYEVVEEAGKKLFGGAKDATVKVIVADGEHSDDIVAEAKKIADDLLNSKPADTDAPRGLGVDIEDLTDDQVDAIADVGIDTLKKLIAFLYEGEIKIEEFEGDEGEIILDVSGEEVGVLIGRHGRTIDALQVAVSAITTKQTGIRYPLSVDVEGYKFRRKQKVIDIAQRAADRASRTGRPVSLKSMTPQERRIVHIALREDATVTTSSEGNGAYRHVVIVPIP